MYRLDVRGYLVSWEICPLRMQGKQKTRPGGRRFFMKTIREGVNTGKSVHIYSEWNAATVIAYMPTALKMTPQEPLEAIRTDSKKVYRVSRTTIASLTDKSRIPRYIST